MGGIGSGARRSTNIGNVEDVLALDIRALRRLGVVRVGECVCETVCWSIGSLRSSSVRLRVDMSDPVRGGVMTIVGDLHGRRIAQTIAIEAVPARLGGYRCYFLCPASGVRCEVIYHGGGRFAGRDAQQLSYVTQNLTELSSIRRKAMKLRKRIDGSGGVGRSRGRNRIRMVQKLRSVERDERAIYFERLAKLAEPSAARKMPGNKRNAR